MGHLLTCPGLSECGENALAIIEATSPKDISEVRSLLGLVQLWRKVYPGLTVDPGC